MVSPRVHPRYHVIHGSLMGSGNIGGHVPIHLKYRDYAELRCVRSVAANKCFGSSATGLHIAHAA